MTTISKRHRGFSLTEVLIAVGTLAVGLTFIGGTFLVGIHLNTVATERTIAAVVADEAFAKIGLYGLDRTDPNLTVDHLTPFESLSHTFDPNTGIDPNEFAYPSTMTPMEDKQYFWSALCRTVSADPNERLVQVTVFVSRRILRFGGYVGGHLWPVPIEVGVSAVMGAGNENMLRINDVAQQTYIGEGATIVSDGTGHIYRVLECDPTDPDVIILDTAWQDGGAGLSSVWVVPPPPSGGRMPGISVYQKLIRF